MGKIECAHGEGVSGWRKKGGKTQSGTGPATLLELEGLKGQEEAGSRAKSGRAQQNIVELVESGKALKLLCRSKSGGKSYPLSKQTPDSTTML